MNILTVKGSRPSTSKEIVSMEITSDNEAIRELYLPDLARWYVYEQTNVQDHNMTRNFALN